MANVQDYFYVLGVYGEVKTTKSSFSLTAPKPLVYLDLDIGFDRTIPFLMRRKLTWRKIKQGDLKTNRTAPVEDILVIEHPLPINFAMKDSARRVVGYNERWEALYRDWITAYELPWVSSVVTDTSTLGWELCHGGVLDELKNPKGEPRVSLTQFEYREPNARYRALTTGARESKKNLVLVHHQRDVTEKKVVDNREVDVKVGETYSGWNRTDAIVDIIVKMTKKQESVLTPGQPPRMATVASGLIETCGLTLDAEGRSYRWPDWYTIVNNVRFLRGQIPITDPKAVQP